MSVEENDLWSSAGWPGGRSLHFEKRRGYDPCHNPLWLPDYPAAGAGQAWKLGRCGLGHRTLEEYFGSNYQGTFVGRYANRIGGASFELNGKTYTLAKNDGNNTLHGGPGGYHQVLWTAETQDGEEPSIIFTHESPDGDEGYPGNLKLKVTYTLKKDNTLALRYDAVCDHGNAL